MTLMQGLATAGAEPFDETGERRDYEQGAALRKEMFENALDARKKIAALLTPEQRAEFQRGWRAARAPG